MNRYTYHDKKREHLHTLDGKPLLGTSGIVKIIGNGGFSWWASGCAVKELGIYDPKLLTKIKKGKASDEEISKLKISVQQKHEEIREMSDDQFLDLLDSAYRAHNTTLKDKAEEGTDLHAELERYVKDQIEGIEFPMRPYHKRIQPFIEWYAANVAKPLWSEIHCYSEKHWIGGISDFGFEDKKGLVAIMDFKSSKDGYVTQFWQCGGYDLEISENGGFNSQGDKIFELPKPIDYYAVLPFGMDQPVPKLEYDVVGCKDAFLSCLSLYQKLPRN